MSYPGMLYWWKARHCGVDFDACSPGFGFGRPFDDRFGGRRGHAAERFAEGGSGAFGVRRPLRFLAYKLDLDEHQVSELAKILADLKTERAQAEVDARRTLSAFADAVSGERFDEARAGEAGALRVESAERLRTAVTRALGRMHALLEPDQRERLAYLIRTGTLVV